MPAVYRGFTNAQQCCFISDGAECWAHLIRKAIRLTLLEPENEEYRRFLDQMLDTYRTAQKFAVDKRLSAAGREQKVLVLMNQVCDGHPRFLWVGGDRFTDDSIPQTDTEKDFRNLVPCQAVN